MVKIEKKLIPNRKVRCDVIYNDYYFMKTLNESEIS